MAEKIIQVEFRLVEFGLTMRKRKPFKDRRPSWIVYAGEHGGILAYKSEYDRWEQLGQTWKSTGYWSVTLPDLERTRPGKRKPVPDRPYYPVHQLSLLAWRGEPEAGSETGRHLNGDPDDNTRVNLDWGTEKENAKDAANHREHRKRRLQELKNCKIEFLCTGETWHYVIKKPGLPDLHDKGPNPIELLKKAISASTLKWFQVKYRYRNVGTDSILPEGSRASGGSGFVETGGRVAPVQFLMSYRLPE